MVLFGWQHISQTQGLLLGGLPLLLLLLLLLSALVEQSELLLEDDEGTLCEDLRLVLREDDAATLVLRE